MSLENVIRYINGKTGYGTENFCYFLYSLIKMEQPNNIVELGVGQGVSTCMMAQALKENGKGVVWGIDNGEAWEHDKSVVWGMDNGEDWHLDGSYENFLNNLLKKLKLEKFVNFKNITLTDTQFFDPQKPIDILFSDATDSGPRGCIDLLRYYLPKMNRYSSIFIDRSSTIHHAYLVLEQIIKHFQDQQIPACLLSSLGHEEVKNFERLVYTSKFTLIHLTETEKAKINKSQNSRAWIKIEPLDLFHHNEVKHAI